MAAMRSFWLCLAALVAAAAAAADSPVRGVSKKQLAAYTPKNGKFTCLSGDRTIDFSSVNDDYCDCPDGSDEPGTSACPNGQFFCRNAGFIGKSIPSSRVGDRVCDCCDGSDELDRVPACPNTCAELAAARRAQLETEQRSTQEGYLAKKAMISEAAAARAEWQATADSLRTQILDADTLISQLEAEAQVLEEAEQEALTAYTAAADGKRGSCRGLDDRYRKFHVRLERAGQMLRDTLVAISVRRSASANADEILNDTTPTLESIADDLDNLVADSQAYMEAAVEASKSDDGGDADAIPVDDPAFPQKAVEGISDRARAKATGGKAVPAKSAGLLQWLDKIPWIGSLFGGDKARLDALERLRAGQGKHSDAASARADLSDARANRATLQRNLDDITKKLERTHLGPEYEYQPLADQCYTLENKEYVYEVCMFNKVEQRKITGGGNTRLGNWQGWKPPTSFTTQSYTGGQKCWNGPDRSTDVQLQCGLETKLISVSEPAKCEYAIVMTTPAACSAPAAVPPAPAGGAEHDEL